MFETGDFGLQLARVNETHDTLEDSLAALSEHTSAEEFRRRALHEVGGAKGHEDEGLAVVDAALKQVTMFVDSHCRRVVLLLLCDRY